MKIVPVEPPSRFVFTKKFRTRVVAMVEMIILPDLFGRRPAAYIHKVYTDVNHQRRGYAAVLVKEAIDSAFSMDCHKAFVVCASGMATFYEKRGMTADQLSMVIRN